MTEDQLKMINGKKKVGWKNESIKKALLIKIHGGKRVLDLVRNTCFPLPSAETINRRIKDLEFSSGILLFNLEVLKAKCQYLDSTQRHFGIVFDEKAIVPGLELNNSTKQFVGNITMELPNHIKQQQLASHGLVFMAMGVDPRIKEIAAFEFTGSSTCPRAMKSYLFNLIIKIENICNISVDFISLDISPVNCSFLKECGISLSKNNQDYFIQHPNESNRKLFVKPDDIHNIKNMVSGIRKHRIKIAKCLVDRYNLSSSFACFSDINKVYTAQKTSNYKIAPKLTQIVLKPNHYEVMNEKNATQMFSSEVSHAIDLLNKTNSKKNSMSFILETFQRFYQVTCHSNWSVENLESYENDVAFLRFLIDDFFNNITFENAYLKSIQAAIMSIRSLISYSQHLFECGLKSIKPSRFLSNAIENLFSLTTAKVSKPSALQFQICLKSISIAGYEQNSVAGSSYSWDEQSEKSELDFLAMLQNTQLDNNQEDNSHDILDGNSDEIELIETITVPDEIDLDAFFNNDLEVIAFEREMLNLSRTYFGLIKCEVCKNMVLLENQFMSRVLFDFYKELEYIFTKLSLSVPPNNVKFEEFFFVNIENINSFDHCFDVKRLICQRFFKYRLKLTLSSRHIHRVNKFASKSLSK